MKWMVQNKLKTNEDKTEVLACSIANRTSTSAACIAHICIEGEKIAFLTKLRTWEHILIQNCQ